METPLSHSFQAQQYQLFRRVEAGSIVTKPGKVISEDEKSITRRDGCHRSKWNPRSLCLYIIISRGQR